jgi:hypothetical protein
MKLYLVTIIIILLILSYLCFLHNDNDIESFGNFKSECKPTELLGKAMTEVGINENKEDWEYYIPCEYDTCEAQVKKFETDETKRKLFLIEGCDVLASKLTLWEVLRNHFKNNANKLMPETFFLHEKDDMKLFTEHFNNLQKKKKNHMFILKNYAQRQEGLKLSNNLKEITESKDKGFYLVQDYLYNPFLISKRKINFRYYTLIICKDGNVSGFIHRSGFVYYTPEFYDEDSMDFNKHITTGYIDRKVYDENPLSLDDFRDHLEDIESGSSKTWDDNVKVLMHNVVDALSRHICKNKKLYNHLRFQLFGSDVAPTADLGAYLMEINKGPDLDAKDERDKKIKYVVQTDMLKLIENNGVLTDEIKFEKIY